MPCRETCNCLERYKIASVLETIKCNCVTWSNAARKIISRRKNTCDFIKNAGGRPWLFLIIFSNLKNHLRDNDRVWNVWVIVTVLSCFCHSFDGVFVGITPDANISWLLIAKFGALYLQHVCLNSFELVSYLIQMERMKSSSKCVHCLLTELLIGFRRC